jgi:hypothetical protein
MASPSVTYTFTNGTTADADQVNSNFTAITTGLNSASGWDIVVNKLTCDTSIISVVDSSDNTKVFTWTLSGATTGKTLTLISAHSDNRSITLPNATDTLVGRDTTDTLTNKTLTSPTLTAPVLGTPASGTLTNCTGLPVSTGISGLGASVADFLATPSSLNLANCVTGETGTGNLVFATNPALTTPNIDTPSAGTLTNCTGLPVSTGISGLGAGVATFLATPSSANLASAVTDGGTGSGALVLATSPSITTSISLVNQAAARFYEQTGNGSNYMAFTAPNAVTSTVTMKLPDGAGSSGQILSTNGSDTLSWASPFTNPMTTTGDIVYSSDGSGTPARLAIGTNDYILRSTGTLPAWENGLATSTVAGFVPAYETTTATLDGGFTGGTLGITMTRIGNVVIITAQGVSTFASASTVTTNSGVLGTTYRPSDNVFTAYQSNGGADLTISIRTDGSIQLTASGARTDSGVVWTISYVIT